MEQYETWSPETSRNTRASASTPTASTGVEEFANTGVTASGGRTERKFNLFGENLT